MPDTFPDAYVCLDAKQVAELCQTKLNVIDKQYDAVHDREIRKLMTNRKLPSWWGPKYDKPLPDLSYEEAREKYWKGDSLGPIPYDTLSAKMTEYWRDTNKKRWRELLSVSQNLSGDTQMYVSSEALAKLMKTD